jgi:hypothetical protein
MADCARVSPRKLPSSHAGDGSLFRSRNRLNVSVSGNRVYQAVRGNPKNALAVEELWVAGFMLFERTSDFCLNNPQ